jgi:DNA-binding CsgD family transcriptional regulator
VAIVLIRRIAPTGKSQSLLPRLVEVFSVLVILKSLANMVLFIALNLNEGNAPSSVVTALSGSIVWNLGGHLLVAAAVGGLGLVFRMPLPAREPPVLKSLMRSYSICALVFAPLGLLEYAVASSGILGSIPFSVDYLFYLGWNVVSMSAAIQLYKPGESGSPVLDEVPQERVKALGLSNRESEMAVMIARGLSNKEIAAELCISPATVRTHIYNLYQKAGARSRVELINKLRS